jgi:hypothetical protein
MCGMGAKTSKLGIKIQKSKIRYWKWQIKKLASYYSCEL